ncbi:hypothetical protein NQ317_013731, partial [Molorchus minor]
MSLGICQTQTLISLLFIHMETTFCTIDLNAAELQYIGDHLTPEECRRLLAAAHYKVYLEPNALDQAERKVSKDISCIELLHHWNSQPGEGKGETHELLEHRLRQMGKYDLADWLGKTVFHELAVDLNRSLEHGLEDFSTESSKKEDEMETGPSLAPVIENSDPTEWSPLDTLLYAVMIGLILTILTLCCKLCYSAICRFKKKKEN